MKIGFADGEKLGVFENGEKKIYQSQYITKYKENALRTAKSKEWKKNSDRLLADEFYFEEDGLTYIQYHLDTSRIDMLPEDRLQNQWYWDNRGFVFEEMELLDKKLSPYRVAVCEIPNDYPVTCCWTGYHNGTDWVWREYTNLDVRELKEEK